MSTASAEQVAFKQKLAALEAHLQTLSDALIAGDAMAFEAHCATLVPQISDFTLTLHALPKAVLLSRPLKNRLRVLGSNLAMQRENMARRAAGVDRALQVLLPPTQGATYGKLAGGYGQAARAPGSFASLHA